MGKILFKKKKKGKKASNFNSALFFKWKRSQITTVIKAKLLLFFPYYIPSILLQKKSK